MTSVYVAPVPVQLFESVTVTSIGNDPFTVGAPESTPAVESVRPAGSVLAVVNVAVPCAPVCVKVWLNGASTVPVFTPGFVTLIVWQLIVSVYVAPVPKQPFVSVALTVIGNAPLTVGVPERTPLEESSVMPFGS